MPLLTLLECLFPIVILDEVANGSNTPVGHSLRHVDARGVWFATYMCLAVLKDTWYGSYCKCQRERMGEMEKCFGERCDLWRRKRKEYLLSVHPQSKTLSRYEVTSPSVSKSYSRNNPRRRLCCYRHARTESRYVCTATAALFPVTTFTSPYEDEASCDPFETVQPAALTSR